MPDRNTDIAELRQSAGQGALPLQIDVEHLAPGRQSEYRLTLHRAGQRAVVLMVRRRRKTLGAYVAKGKLTEVRVPLNCSWREIHQFLEARFDWIIKSEQAVAEIQVPPESTYEAGDRIRFLGESLTLDLHRQGRSAVQWLSQSLHVGCPDPSDPAAVQRQVERWYRHRAEALFPQRIAALNSLFGDDRQPSRLRIRKMKSRWGSCSSRGDLCLNLYLIREPLPQIDLVIAHELCHLRHFPHNRAFYDLMTRVMPDWRARDKLLGSL